MYRGYASATIDRPGSALSSDRQIDPRPPAHVSHDGAQHLAWQVHRARVRYAALDRDAKTAQLEKRVAQLGQRLSDGKGGVRDPDDLQAIRLQQQRAFYNCE